MKIFVVYPDKKGFKFVSESFNWFAFFLPFIWLIFNGLWTQLAVFSTLTIAIYTLIDLSEMQIYALILVCININCGINSCYWIQAKLEKKNKSIATLFCSSLKEAYVEFYKLDVLVKEN